MSKSEPRYLQHVFPAGRVPRLGFSEDGLPLAVPPAAHCIDATLSLGLGLLSPPSSDQALELWHLLFELDGSSGLVRQAELPADGPVSREVLRELVLRRERGELGPEPVAAVSGEPAAVAPLRDTGVRTIGLSIAVGGQSLRLGASAEELPAFQALRAALDACLDLGARPRIDLVDVTRADIAGFLLPLCEALSRHFIKREAGALHLRLVDAVGVAGPWPQVPLPRSLPRLLHELRQRLGLQPRQLEVVTANDLGLAVANALAAVMHGCAGVVTTICGVGDRSGLAPTELVALHLAGLQGRELDYRRLPELARLLGELGLEVPPRHPLWGRDVRAARLAPELEPFDLAQVIGKPAGEAGESGGLS